MFGGFASFFYSAVSNLERNWKKLVADIAAGEIISDVGIDQEMKQRLSADLIPNPKRAAELTVRSEFRPI